MTLVDVAAAADVPVDGTAKVEIDGVEICLVNAGGIIHALHNTCTHAMERMSGGWVEGDRIECPRHGAAFSVITGEALSLPATKTLPTFHVEVQGGRVLLDPTPSHPHPLLDR